MGWGGCEFSGFIVPLDGVVVNSVGLSFHGMGLVVNSVGSSFHRMGWLSIQWVHRSMGWGGCEFSGFIVPLDGVVVNSVGSSFHGMGWL